MDFVSKTVVLFYLCYAYSFLIAQAISPKMTECCQRENKLITAGFDLHGKPVQIDIGHCRKTCNENERGILSNAMHLNPRHASCFDNGMCRPTAVAVHVKNLLGGESKHEVIEDCKCVDRPAHCTRLPMKKVFHPNSPYEVTIDVGMCAGHCNKGRKCRITQNETVTIGHPNGKQCIQVISKCSCEEACYRVPHTQAYYESIPSAGSNHHSVQVKQIDVGRCVGECSSLSQLCVLRPMRSTRLCLMSLNSNRSCTPVKYTAHRFRNQRQKEELVLAIEKCACA